MCISKTTPTAFFLLTCIILVTACVQQSTDAAQPRLKDTLQVVKGNDYASIDQSPLDMAYCPADYPQKKMQNGMAAGTPVARVVYSRPHKKGRKIFGTDTTNICPYGKPWRLGANESTEITFFQPAVINGNNIAAGRYVLYCIPQADKWVIVFNSNVDSWGLNIEPSKDLFRVEVPVQVQTPVIEDFTMLFQETASGADLLMTWDNVNVTLPVTFVK